MSVLLVCLAGISVVTGFLLSTFDFSLRAVNRFIVELDSREGEKYPDTINFFFKNRELYNRSISKGKYLFGFIFIICAIILFGPSVVSVLLVFICLLIANEILPRLIALFIPGFFVEKMYWPVMLNFLFFRKFTFNKKFNYSENNEITGVEEESLENEEMEIFKNVLNLPEVKLRECLIPRTEICAVKSDSSTEEVLNKFIETKFSRILVYEGSIDKIIGYIHTKDLLNGKGGTVKSMLRKVEYFPEEMSAKDLLSRMIKAKSSICVILDEYGGTSGIVTLEDLIEEIFGEIKDELDKEELQERVVSDSEFVFSGRLEIKYLNKEYGLNLPEGEEYETLGGYITFIKENIPTEGEIFNIEGYRLKVLKIRNNSIASVHIRILE
jgi:CBS domain containing-hemolysin-like protein